VISSALQSRKWQLIGMSYIGALRARPSTVHSNEQLNQRCGMQTYHASWNSLPAELRTISDTSVLRTS